MNLTIVQITTRGLLGRKRFLALLPLPAILIGLSVLCTVTSASATSWGKPVLFGLGIAVVLPVVALLIGTGVLGSEIDDGTITHVLTKPLPRSVIVASKYLVASVVTFLAAGVPLTICAAMAEGPELAGGMAIGALLGSLAYTGLFLTLSLVSRRPVLLGLVYVMLWEGLLGNAVSGTKLLSVEQYVLTIADHWSGTQLFTTTMSPVAAVVMATVFAVAGGIVATRRLARFQVRGETG